MGGHRYRVLRLCLAAILFAASYGCEDEPCRSGEQRCDGPNVSTCQSSACHACLFSAPGRNHWASQRCPHACAEDGDLAFCAVSSEPDVRCLAGSSFRSFCDGSALLSCRDQFLTDAHDCASACVAPRPAAAFCAASSEQDPGCERDASSPTMTCPGTAIERCTEGYAECAPRFSFGETDDAGTPSP